MSGFIRKNCGFFVLAAVFALSVVIVNPIGNFPLDDDFAYGRTVLNFLHGNYRISGWISATVIFQTFIGMLFSMILGFSFTVLRFASIFIAFLGVSACYFALKELKFSEKLAVLGSLLLLFNPLYFSKAFNFHSDIYFVAMMLFSVLFYVMAVNRGYSIFYLTLGSLFSVFAILVRQNGVFIPVGVVAFLLVNRKLNLRRFFVVAVVPFVAFAAYEFWFYFIHGVTESGSLMSEYDLPHIADLVFRLVPFRLFAIFIYAGLLLLPLSFPLLLRFKSYFYSLNRLDKAIFSLLCFGGISGIAFMYFFYHKLLFYMPTMIHSSGLGPVYLQGFKLPVFPAIVLFALALASVLSASVISLKIKSGFTKSGSLGLVYLVGFFQLVFLMLILTVFDRYLLPIFFPIIVLLLVFFNRTFFSFRLAVILVALMAVFSVAGTQDYLSWNRARNEAIGGLLAQGIQADKIDGGFEHAAWNFYEFTKANPKVNNAKPYDPGWIRDYFPVIDSEYVVSFSPLERYSVLKEYSYFSLLTLRNEKIYALKRD